MGKYFTIEELCKSSTAEKRGISNVPNYTQKKNLEELIKNILDPLREAYGKPIYVNSGFRSRELNIAVKGASMSEHKKGMAADLDVHSREGNKQLFELIQKLNLPFRQLIDEKDFSWVHVSYDPNDIKRQVLKL